MGFRLLGEMPAGAIISRNEVGRLSLKSHVNINVIKVWLHLVSLPDTSIAEQCLLLSNQLANIGTLNFYSTFKTDVSTSEYLDLIKHEKLRQAVAELPSSNHKLRIKTDRYHRPKGIQQYCMHSYVF